MQYVVTLSRTAIVSADNESDAINSAIKQLNHVDLAYAFDIWIRDGGKEPQMCQKCGKIELDEEDNIEDGKRICVRCVFGLDG